MRRSLLFGLMMATSSFVSASVTTTGSSAKCENITYPRKLIEEGISGKVMLNAIVGTKGLVVDATIIRSSGNKDLDRAAIQALEQCTFAPHRYTTGPAPKQTRIDVVFTID